MSPTDLVEQNAPTSVEEKAERVDRVKKDSADAEKKSENGWQRPVGLIDLTS